MIVKATTKTLDDPSDSVEIEALPVVPVAGDLIVINTLVGGKRGIFRVRQRMIWTNMVYLWVKFVEDT